MIVWGSVLVPFALAKGALIDGRSPSFYKCALRGGNVGVLLCGDLPFFGKSDFPK